MRNFTVFITLLLLTTSLAWSQTSHLVVTSGLTFVPAQLTINVGDTVIWRNEGLDLHNVNGSTATYPNNPAGFSNGAPSSSLWEFRHVFTLPGTYTYQCDPHVSANMFGFITVNGNTGGGVDLVISEIMYNPPESGVDTYEYIELYNNGSNAVNLLNYGFTAGVEYTFNSGYNLGAGDYVLFAVDSVAFAAAFGINAFQFTAGSLSNGGELIAFADPTGNIVDSVDFDDSFPWPIAADGFGASLVLCDVNSDNNDGANWAAANTGTGVISGGIEIFGNPGSASACPEGATVRFLDTALEVAEDQGTATVRVEIRDAGDQDYTVAIEADAASTATVGTDIAFSPTSLTFLASAGAVDTLEITLTITDDLAPETLELLRLNLVNASMGLTINGIASTSNITITDNDTDIPNVVITEIMYSPPGTDTESEYLELYNNGSTPVELAGFYFSAGIVDTLPAYTLAAGGYLLLSVDAANMEALYGVTALQWESGSLNNSGELIELRDASGNVVDAVQYGVAGAWPSAANGSGPALILCDANADNSLAASWIAGVQPTGVFISGIQILGSPGASNNCTPPEPMGYTPYPVGTVTSINANGVIDSLGVQAELTGIVYGVNLRPNGLQFTIIDAAGDGIGAFSSSATFGYTVTEGDEVTLQGTVSQFSGLAQMNLDTVILNSMGNALVNPTPVTVLNEDTESQLVELTGVTITDVVTAGGLNVTLDDGQGNTYLMRIDFDTDITEAFITGLGGNTLKVVGIGGQFDGSEPYDEGYQILPRYQADITVINRVEEPVWGAGVAVFPNPVRNQLTITSAVDLEQVVVKNGLGQPVLRIAAGTSNRHVFSVATLAAGVYFVEMYSGGERVVRRLVKQ